MKSASRALVAVVFVIAASSAVSAQEPARWSNLERAHVAADSFGFRVNGRQLGVQVVKLEQVDGDLRFEETTTLPQVTQTTEVTMSSELALRSVRQRGNAAGREMRIDVAFDGAHATGSALTPAAGSGEIAIDATLPAGAIDDNVLTALLPAIDWSATTDVVVPLFHSGKNETVEMRMRVTGTQTVEVPAGSFETFRVETSGDEAPLVFFIESAAPHRLVRLEITGAPVEIVRLNQ